MKSCCLLLIEEVNLSLIFAALLDGLFREIRLFTKISLPESQLILLCIIYVSFSFQIQELKEGSASVIFLL